MTRKHALPVLILSLAASMPGAAQPPGAGAGQERASAREVAPFDPQGHWVSLVTEDWRFRMISAPAGDYEGIPLNRAGREVADAWDPAADEAAGEACRAYGAGGVMRMPTRLHISWEGDDVLRIDADAGEQTRLLKFGPAADGEGGGTWQGVSEARWQLERAAGFGAPVVSGSIQVETRDMRPGYLRRNGVPYSEEATLTEYFELINHGEDQYLMVISVLEDPRYLDGPVLTSTNFKREPDGDNWNPAPCRAK